MIAYVLIAIFPLLLCAFFPNLNNDDYKKRKYLTICGIVLILFIGLRSKYVGSVDSSHYYAMMDRALVRGSWKEYYDPDYVEGGFQFFVYVLSRIFDSSQYLFVITGIIFVTSVMYCIYKNSENVVLSTVMYITLGLMQFEMQGMRQAIAMSICMVSFEFVKKKKIIPFALLMLVATQFHRTALVFAIVYFLVLLSYNFWSILIIAVGSGVIFYFADTLMNFANDLFDTEYTYTIDSGGFIATAIYILIVIFAMVFNKDLKQEKDDKKHTLIMFVTIAGMLSYIMRYVGVGIAERISYYFMFGQILLLPNSTAKMKIEFRATVNIAVYLLCIGLFVYRLNGSDFIPFKFFWDSFI